MSKQTSIKKNTNVILKGRVCQLFDHWVTVRLKNSGSILEIQKKDVYLDEQQKKE